MKAQILKILRETRGYVSGQELCEKLSVSRTTIWKVVGQLKSEGYVIEGIRNRGYRLVDVPDSIDEKEIRSRLHTQWLGKEIYYQKSVDSTNSWAKRLAEEGKPSGTVVVADVQTNGKGRRGRSWETPERMSVPLSILLRPDFAPEKASMLTLVMGLSVVQALENAVSLQCSIKWPNDVLISEKKVCGILAELYSQIDNMEYMVVGAGVNANMTEFPEELANKATSLRNELGRPVQRALLVAYILEAFEKNYEKFLHTQDLRDLKEEYTKRLLNTGRPVRILQPQEEFEGVARGIDTWGNLLVERTDSGVVEQVYAGEVSVRGLHGYV
jgi:BirA family biotin operon repressor/biotin-[acetyl-CoA-carboxylase] ligase